MCVQVHSSFENAILRYCVVWVQVTHIYTKMLRIVTIGVANASVICVRSLSSVRMLPMASVPVDTSISNNTTKLKWNDNESLLFSFLNYLADIDFATPCLQWSYASTREQSEMYIVHYVSLHSSIKFMTWDILLFFLLTKLDYIFCRKRKSDKTRIFWQKDYPSHTPYGMNYFSWHDKLD